MNSIITMGRLTAAPEVRTSQSGKAVASFTVAVDRRTKDKQTDFFRCVAFDKTADNIERFFNKGDKILLRGSMQMDQYEKDGKKLTSWTMVVNEFDFVESRDTQPKLKQKAADTPNPSIEDMMGTDDFPF